MIFLVLCLDLRYCWLTEVLFSSFHGKVLVLSSSSGADPEISERGGGGGSRILERGGPKFDFSVPLSVIFL